MPEIRPFRARVREWDRRHMCRFLGIASSEPTAFRILLREAPNSLATLSEKHPDGWGIAVHADDWRIEKEARCAREDSRFHESALSAEGTVLVAHIRQKTVGQSSIANTHPFRRGRWVFAHNGTVKDVAHLRAHASRARLAEVEGDTDSELLFAYLLTRIDETLANAPSGPRVSGAYGEASEHALLDAVLAETTNALRARADFGSFNFLLSDGEVTYAHRFGRSLFVLTRAGHVRKHAVLVASEKITNEPWTELAEGTLLRIDRRPVPAFRYLSCTVCSASA
jgi:glutamine amidotransferase